MDNLLISHLIKGADAKYRVILFDEFCDNVQIVFCDEDFLLKLAENSNVLCPLQEEELLKLGIPEITLDFGIGIAKNTFRKIASEDKEYSLLGFLLDAMRHSDYLYPGLAFGDMKVDFANGSIYFLDKKGNRNLLTGNLKANDSFNVIVPTEGSSIKFPIFAAKGYLIERAVMAYAYFKCVSSCSNSFGLENIVCNTDILKSSNVNRKALFAQSLVLAAYMYTKLDETNADVTCYINMFQGVQNGFNR